MSQTLMNTFQHAALAPLQDIGGRKIISPNSVTALGSESLGTERDGGQRAFSDPKHELVVNS
jgi:hypothetical protein